MKTANAVSQSLESIENQPNASRTMSALRELGYDSYNSIMDLMDNSIDAGATQIRISIEKENVGRPNEDILISIADDGCGMSRETLSEALRIGSDTAHEATDLGKFGMGLVTASIGLSRRVEVATKEAEGKALIGVFDLDDIAKANKFVKQIGETDASRALADEAWDSGTVVRLSKTDRISNRTTTDFAGSLRKTIGRVFRKFIASKRLVVLVNEKQAEAYDPLMELHKEHPSVVVLEETPLTVGGRQVGTVKAVEMPDLGKALNTELEIAPRNAGFYVMRNNREIVAAELFGMWKEHPNITHFRAEISFDSSADDLMHVDVKKASITPSQALKDVLRQLCGGLIQQSSRKKASRANTEKGKMDHSIAEAAIPRRATLIPKPKALIERRPGKPDSKGSHSTGDGSKTRTPNVTQLRTPAGLAVEFNEGDYGEAPFYVVEQQGRKLIITYNRDHSFYRELSEHRDSARVIGLVDYLVFALANTELMMPEEAQRVKATMNATLVGVMGG